MSETRFHTLLKAKVAVVIEERSASLAKGAAQDYPQYQRQVGYLLGLEDALKLCDEIEAEFSQ